MKSARRRIAELGRVAATAIVAASTLQYPARGQSPAPTRLVVLPVNHSQQLVAKADNAGFLTDLISQLKPTAICVENDPNDYVRSDYYDFLYEQTSIILPLVRERNLELFPIDWKPGTDEDILAFGGDLDHIPLIRPTTGWGSFLTFPEVRDLSAQFLDPQPEIVARVQRWAKTEPKDVSLDAARRLYLFRTFLQAKRVAAVAHAHPGGTILLVIGEFHKWDIERILASDRQITIEQPAAVFRPDPLAAEKLLTTPQRMAVLTFNLLGLQAMSGNVDWDWMRSELSRLPSSEPSAERELLQIRLDQLTRRLTPARALRRLSNLLKTTSSDVGFTWTGASDPTRLDSYFDPFGNMSVRQRILVELARGYLASGRQRLARATLDQATAGLNEQKVYQFRVYVDRFLVPHQARSHT